MALIAVVAVTGCETNVPGKLSATKSGDRSNPPAARSRFDRHLAHCGAGLTRAGSLYLHRAPAVQDVTPASAAFVWAGEGGKLTLEGGGERHEVRADRDGLRLRFPQWTARVSGLSPDTVYCYTLTRGKEVVFRAGFRTAPTTTPRRPVRFAVFGDSGKRTVDQRAVLAQLEWVPFEFLLLLGDIAYERGRRRELEANVFAVYADVLARAPAYPAAGNHDYKTRDGAPLREMFALPENGGEGGIERWYSFDWGPVHVVVADSERLNKTQIAWLDADLAASKQPWTVFAIHRPLYSSGHHGGDRRVRERLESLLIQHRVDLVLSGHDHHYERSVPMDGVIYIVSGGGGRGTRAVGESSFTAFSDQVAHFLFITADATNLRVHAIDATGVEFDSLSLTRAAE